MGLPSCVQRISYQTEQAPSTDTTILFSGLAMLCYMGKEPDPDSHNKYRWVIPVEDPCQCTKVQMGSVNTRTPCRPFKVTYYDTFLLSDDPVEIRKLLNCTEGMFLF